MEGSCVQRVMCSHVYSLSAAVLKCVEFEFILRLVCNSER